MVIHTFERLTSVRNLASWGLYAFAAGSVNLGALMACKRFVAHVTGTLTLLGADAGELLGLDYLLVFLFFMLGAGAAVVSVQKLANGARTLPYWIPLSTVSLILVGVALLGVAGCFGTFGGTVETAHDFVFLCILSFAMGMQNAAVATSTAMAVRTTHMTGPATDFAVAAATLIAGKTEERARAWASLTLRGAKLAAFVVGAAVMVPICNRVGFLAFLVPAVASGIATAMTFAPRQVAAALAANATES